MGSSMTLLRVYPQIGVGVYRTQWNFIKSAKWHSDRFVRPRKVLRNKILQINCSFEENVI